MNERDISGKTYDQQLELAGDGVANLDISPNRRVPGEMVFEPLGTGVRVTARDECHRTLWGFVASKPMLDEVHCLVAVYDPLFRLIKEELERHRLPAPEDSEPLAAARRNIAQLEETLRHLKRSLDVKEVKAPTLDRARVIARMTGEALRQIGLDSEGLKGMKSRSAPEAPSND